jgi:hypothetical protein
VEAWNVGIREAVRVLERLDMVDSIRWDFPVPMRLILTPRNLLEISVIDPRFLKLGSNQLLIWKCIEKRGSKKQRS